MSDLTITRFNNYQLTIVKDNSERVEIPAKINSETKLFSL